MENFEFPFLDDYFLNEESQQPESEIADKNEAVVGPRITADCYRLGSTGNALHQAIRKGREKEIEALLDVYLADFQKIRNYLVQKYQWDPNDKIWIRKANLIAVDEESCRKCKVLEKSSSGCSDLQRAIFVVLKSPINGEDVAVLHPSRHNRMGLFRLVRELLPNGCLSWDYPGHQTDPNGKNETFVETAASCGRHNLITRLYELGAALGFPGHNALVAACTTQRENTIRWLLTEHFDHFDFTQKNDSQMNGFHILLQRNRAELMDFVLQKMISYRTKYFNETESEAFNRVFHCEEYEYSSTLSLMRKGPASNKIEEYIEKYGLDLSYQWKGVTILEHVLRRKLALDFCCGAIRQTPKLLGLIVSEGTTIVHVCIELGHLEFLKEMYQIHPEAKQYFETDGSFACLEGVLHRKCHDAVSFIFDNHIDFFLKHMDRMKSQVISSIQNYQDVYESNYYLLAKYFPSLKNDLEERRTSEPEFHTWQDFQEAFRIYDLQFKESAIITNDPTQRLNTVRGCKGLTLLHYAVDKNNIELFLFLMQSGCDIDAVDDDGNHLIHFVRSIEMFDFIIDKHPDGRYLVHRTNTQGQTILHRIFSFSIDFEPLNSLMEKIISYGADVNLQDNNGESIAFLISNDDQLTILEKYNLNLELVNRTGESVLERHLKYRNVFLARDLLRHLRTKPSFKDQAHKYLEPFMLSNRDFFSCDYQPFLEDNPDTTKLIFDSVYHHSREEASRLFCKAAGSAHIFITEKFLEFDYDLDYNYQDQDGYTPIVGLLSYMEEPNLHLVEQVLAKGVDLEIRNSWGRTALLMFVDRFGSAKWYGHGVGTAELLLDHGASINSSDSNDGNTALHYAFQNHDLCIAELLIDRGADLKARNKEGRKPLDMVSKQIYELIKFLEYEE
ncbi:hypothetical protein RP20_CCG015590 [Aedes albopictus]|nr:uncharacterized protein LOC115270169 [Aedes albopictus]KXJ73546.1 hypothetical protein RP20_CCG015590 [Aedes albopictus]